MLWMAAFAGTQIAQAYLGASLGKAQAQAQERLEKANAASANRVRAAENAMSGARANLARFTQSVNNQRVLEATGDAVEANIVNFRRQDDALVRGSFVSAIEDAETRGSMAAQAALTGVEGSAVHAVNAATALRSARARREATLFRNFSTFDAASRAASIVQQGLQGMDSSLIFTDRDSNISVGREFAKPSPIASAIIAGVDQLAKMGMAGAFSGPASATSAGTASKFSFANSGARLGDTGGGGFWGSGARLGG